METTATEKRFLPKIQKPLVFVGMMGVGKTTYGKKLAKRLELEFYDADEEVEKEIGHSVSWIFQNAGEEEFRKLELKKIEEILRSRRPLVLALGGGAFISQKVRDVVKKYATSIWLKADPEIILYRVSQNNKRPLLNNVEDKLGKIKEILIERIKYYEQADIHINSSQGSQREIIANIISSI